jgi:hypothetical protein
LPLEKRQIVATYPMDLADKPLPIVIFYKEIWAKSGNDFPKS